MVKCGSWPSTYLHVTQKKNKTVSITYKINLANLQSHFYHTQDAHSLLPPNPPKNSYLTQSAFLFKDPPLLKKNSTVHT